MIDNLKLKLITLDGPVAVGKSSVGQLLAKRLGFSFFDTGLMYRAFTWKVLRLNVCLFPVKKGFFQCSLTVRMFPPSYFTPK